LVALWEKSNDEEKEAATLIEGLTKVTNGTEIETYFDFTEKWNALFPKEDNERYKRGQESVKVGSKLAGVGGSTVYGILRTCNFYGRDTYRSLRQKAEKNDVIIYWRHLRFISDQLSDPKYNDVRTTVEQKLVEDQQTESSLSELITTYAPDRAQIKRNRDLNFKSIFRQCKKFSEKTDGFKEAFEGEREAFTEIAKSQEMITKIEEFQDVLADINGWIIAQSTMLENWMADLNNKSKSVKKKARSEKKSELKEDDVNEFLGSY
jgi:hypothetical protein